METESLAGCCQKEYNPLCGVIVWLCGAGETNLVVVVANRYNGAFRRYQMRRQEPASCY